MPGMELGVGPGIELGVRPRIELGPAIEPGI